MGRFLANQRKDEKRNAEERERKESKRQEGGLPGLLRLWCLDAPVSLSVAFRLASVPES